MNKIQEQTIARQQARADRLISKAHETKAKRDQINAAWAWNTLDRMYMEAEE